MKVMREGPVWSWAYGTGKTRTTGVCRSLGAQGRGGLPDAAGLCGSRPVVTVTGIERPCRVDLIFLVCAVRPMEARYVTVSTVTNGGGGDLSRPWRRHCA